IVSSGGFMNAAARVDQTMVVDIHDPGSPSLLPSIKVGVGTDHGTDTVSGDEHSVFVNNAVDNTVSQIDAATRAVVKTIPVKEKPRALATFSSVTGPGYQTG